MASRHLRALAAPPTDRRATNPFVAATSLLMLVGLAGGLVAAVVNPILLFYVMALLCGWSEVGGACGLAHLGTITPLRDVDDTHHLWFLAVGGYTLGGLVTASAIGSSLGLLGASVGLADSGPIVLATVAAVTVALVAHALGWPSFRLPQVPRQTNKFWAFEFGIVPAATMWGAHIGIGFATVISHGGLFVVAALATVLGPIHGALLFATFWTGRTLPLWLMPHLLRGSTQSTQSAIAANSVYGYAAALGLSCAVAAIVMIVSA